MKKMTLALLLILLVMGVASLHQAQEKSSVEVSTSLSLTPEVEPYRAKIESYYRVLSLLVEQAGPLRPGQLLTLQELKQRIETMKMNIETNQQGRPYLRHLLRPVEQMMQAIDQASVHLSAGRQEQAKALLERAYRLATVCSKQPVCQLIVAEQEVAAGAEYMASRNYEEAVQVLDLAIEHLGQIPVSAATPYADDLHKVKSEVFALRRLAREKTVVTPGQKLLIDLANAFNEAHESVYDMWSGPADIKHIR